MELDIYTILIVVLFIVILVTAWKDPGQTGVLMAGLLLLALILSVYKGAGCSCGKCSKCAGKTSERFKTAKRKEQKSGREGFASEYGPYGNITVIDDIDTMQQRIIDPVVSNFSADNDPATAAFDATDVVMAVIDQGANLNMPPGQAITTSDSALMSSLTLAMPGGTDAAHPMFDTSAGSNMNVDEQIARKSQHRGQLNRRAIDGIVRNTRQNYDRIYDRELDYNENRVWWETDNSKSTANDFWPFDINL